jgi:hypothetical protein
MKVIKSINTYESIVMIGENKSKIFMKLKSLLVPSKMARRISSLLKVLNGVVLK